LRFDQPCAAFKINGECAVYSDRPCACRDFFCKLLNRFRKGEISRSDAKDIIELAKQSKSELVSKAQETGEFSDSQLKVFHRVVERIENDFSSQKSKKKYSELHLNYTALGYFLNKNFYSGHNKTNK